jgi:2-hydroxychromene-2-carboxylate isomerase
MKRIDFFFDLSSPYSYMASTQIEKVAQQGGAELRWRPMVLAAVFKATGNDMPARIAAKAKYMFRDLEHWAAEYGVPFKFTSRFPVNAITPERLVIAADAEGKAGAAARAAFHALWVEDRDVTADGELRQIAAAAGLDVERAMAAITSQPVKDQLRANTDEAIAKGAFGAPAIVVTVGDKEELFWGNDRLHFVERMLRE